MDRVGSILCGMALFCAVAVIPAYAMTMSAIYAHDVLGVSVALDAPHSGEAEFHLEVLSPEDKVIGNAIEKKQLAEGVAFWKADVALDGALPLDEMIWHRVRFTLRYSGAEKPVWEEIRSIGSILRRPVLHVLAQNSYIAGAHAAMRVIVADSFGDEAVGEGAVRIALIVPSQKPRLLFSGRLDRRGTADAEFSFPQGMQGRFLIKVTAETALGKVETSETVQLQDQVSILLTSEKPMYQPSQTMHLRALALNRADHHAVIERPLTFEVEDSRGNKVFRKATATDNFGIASAEFTLADEVNLGVYHARATLDGAEGLAADINLDVEHYVLPKFRVVIDFPTKDGKQKRDYRPGDHVRGTVKASYFFGKAVSNAAVSVKASAMDVELFQAASSEGRTDSDGVYHFDLTLPSFLAGSGSHHGAAPVVVEATVKDAAEHAEMRGEPITVSKDPLVITAIPEGGQLVRGLRNEVFLLVSYPDGTPAKAELEVMAGNVKHKANAQKAVDTINTNDAGIATVQLSADETNTTLRVQADDRKGNRAEETLQMETRDGEDQVLLRTSHAVYKPGDPVAITVLSTRQRGAVYVDVVRNGQTILTRDLDLKDGRADLQVNVGPEMSGTLMVDAYVIGQNGRETEDQRLVYVQPADELRIEASSDAGSYLPGSTAKVNFRVTNKQGAGVSAALGLEVVDQAVFALAEKQPGFAKVFFYLEQELMKPRFEIHSLAPAEIVEPAQDDTAEHHDLAARVLFAAASTVTPHSLDSEAGHTLPDTQAAAYRRRYQNSLLEYVKSLAAKMTKMQRPQDIPAAFLALKDDTGREPHDGWGTKLRVEPWPWSPRSSRLYVVRSAGPDRDFNTADDFVVWLEPKRISVSPDMRGWYSAPREDTITIRMEHDRGANNGMAVIVGKVSDVTGAVVPGASVHIERIEGGRERATVSDAVGDFSFTGLPPGKYKVRVGSPGFEISGCTITLAARDLGNLAVKLNVGAVTEAVTVEAQSIALQTESAEVRGRAMLAGVPAPMRDMQNAPEANQLVFLDKKEKSGADSVTAAGHVRSYFPEALYINPEILTGGDGKASIEIPLADSITTWRMAMFASTVNGALGASTSDLKVFQDFFVDLDLPVTLTQGDRISIPVAVYNYSGHPGNVALTLQPDDWFAMDSSNQQTVSVESGQVGAGQFTIVAKRIGKFRLTLTGRMRGDLERDDTVVREIEVVPNGEQKEIVFNGRLETTEQRTVRFPASAIPNASKIVVRLYPGPLSQVIEGMDGVLRMPFGCFEQTSSSTYPNVLALDYMKRTGKLTPEIHAKAEGFIATGYQRLLTFEVAGGGFSWFGNAPANKILTAYGLMEFYDMARVYDVDPRLIERTRDWLAEQQQPDGSWKPDIQFINEGATNRFNTDVLRITAYVALALETAEYKGDAVEKARKYIENHLDQNADSYTLAVIANFAVAHDKESALAHRSLSMLREAAQQKGEMSWWSANETGVYGTGESAAVETTGLAVQALLKAGEYSDVVRRALAWIISRKSGDGNWETTQATIMALRALVEASEQSGTDAHGTVDVLLNGAKMATVEISKKNNDLLHQFALHDVNEQEGNEVELRFHGEGGMAYQVDGRYFVPWKVNEGQELLAIEVKYDRTRMAQDAVATAIATIRNNTGKIAKMVMVDLGIPPGFELQSEDLQDLVEKTAQAKSGRLEKFNLTATQGILYFDSIAAHDSFDIRFRLKAKYPIRASGFASRVYEYYDPKVSAVARPVQFEVTAH